jgi:predicted CoA-binding protein
MKTLVIGASTNPSRYSYKAAEMLKQHKIDIVLLGRDKGVVADAQILNQKEDIQDKDIDTVTLYVSQPNQSEYRDYLMHLRPRRVIFNPGTENPDLARSLNRAGILTEDACTLVLLSTNQF